MNVLYCRSGPSLPNCVTERITSGRLWNSPSRGERKGVRRRRQLVMLRLQSGSTDSWTLGFMALPPFYSVWAKPMGWRSSHFGQASLETPSQTHPDIYLHWILNPIKLTVTQGGQVWFFSSSERAMAATSVATDRPTREALNSSLTKYVRWKHWGCNPRTQGEMWGLPIPLVFWNRCV